jgi:hypothetical protein
VDHWPMLLLLLLLFEGIDGLFHGPIGEQFI